MNEFNHKRAAFMDYTRKVKTILIPFWKTKDSRWAKVFLGGALLLKFCSIYLTYQFSMWSKNFFNSLQSKDSDMFFHQLWILFLLSMASLFCYANETYFSSRAIIMWRRWLSDRFAKAWLFSKAYYKNNYTKTVDNPDQRIAEDLAIAPSKTVSLIFDMIDSIGTLGVFMVILWNLSTNFPIMGVQIPGILLWIALIYVIIGSYLTHIIGRPLIGYERLMQQYEANYRHKLIRIREKAKSVSFFKGDLFELALLRDSFSFIYNNYKLLIKNKKNLRYFSFGYDRLSAYFPYIIASPQFFIGRFQLGELIQTAQAFNSVRANLSWFIYNYGDLAEWKATFDRLLKLEHLLSMSEASSDFHYNTVHEGLRLEDLDVNLPDGTHLFTITKAHFKEGHRYALCGPSGVGKSTLFYVLNKLWMYGKGSVTLPEKDVLYLPQTPYLPLTSLRDALYYPHVNSDPSMVDPNTPHDQYGAHDHAPLKNLLEKVHLSYLYDKLDEKDSWDHVLSLGEQQRLSFAKIWLHKPQWVLLDEALSAVDEPTQMSILNAFKEDFPNVTVIGIEHHLPKFEFYNEIIYWEQLTSPRP